MNEVNQNILSLESKLNISVFELPIKCFVVKHSRGGILISPLPNLNEHLEKMSHFAKITDIVAPNLLHHLGAKKAKRLFPEAKLWAAPGLEKKRSDINWEQELYPSAWPYTSEIEIIPILGMPNVNETAFFHKSSRTLIVTDLVFNLQNINGWANSLIFRLFGTYKKPALSRLFLSQVQDKSTFIASIEKLCQLEFENILLPHGESLLGNGKSTFLELCRTHRFIKN